MELDQSVFPLFGQLPAELRSQIWWQALPIELGPALHFHKRGCWRARHLTEEDEGYEPGFDDRNMAFEYRSDLLDKMELNLSMAYVNHEARAIAITWAKEQGLEKRLHDDGRKPSFVRPFDSVGDALYVPHQRWHDFLFEAANQPFEEPDLVDRFYETRSDILRLAIPEDLLTDHDIAEDLLEMFRNFFNVKVLYVVIDPPPDCQLSSSESHTATTHPWWSWTSADGTALFWDSQNREFHVLDWHGQPLTTARSAYTWEKATNEALVPLLIGEHIQDFEIRPIFIFRKVI